MIYAINWALGHLSDIHLLAQHEKMKIKYNGDEKREIEDMFMGRIKYPIRSTLSLIEVIAQKCATCPGIA